MFRTIMYGRSVGKKQIKKGGVHQKTKFPTKVMVWLGVCGEGLTVPVIMEDGKMDAERYIDEVLPIALKSGIKC